ncbi:MAG TPA: methyl-accepting chemotaxis protein, partial [Negativicutes bacterium]|nr:methyl-accepting chemotaxis protein [Negativicutes bacterium]
MSEEQPLERVLAAFDTLLPYLPDFFTDEVAFSFTDTGKFLRVVCSAAIRPGVKPGDPISADGADIRAMRSDRPVTVLVPKEVFGIAIKSTSIPIKDSGGAVIGSVSVAASLERQSEVSALADT